MQPPPAPNMSEYRETSIFNPTAIKRGYDHGIRCSKLTRDVLEAGHSLDFLTDAIERESKTAEKWGLISPIGTAGGAIRSCKQLAIGLFVFV